MSAATHQSSSPESRRKPNKSGNGIPTRVLNRFANLMDSLRSQLWPAPLAAIIVAVAAGQFLPFLDREVDGNSGASFSAWLFGGGPDAASNLLQTISGAMVTVTSLTFSLTVVTLQLASSQFSPRLLRTFTSDKVVHGTLALFLATFAYSLTVLRSIRVSTATDDGFVPRISTTLAFLLAVASVLTLVIFLSHLARQIRVENMLKTVFDEADATLKRIFDESEDLERPQPGVLDGRKPGFRPIESPSSGFLLSVNTSGVCEAAREAKAFVVFETTPGDSLIRGVPFAHARSTTGGELGDEALETLSQAMSECVATGAERTSVQDVTLGLQQLLDIAGRALSPGINDATTAVHAIGHVSALLCGLADRNTGSQVIRDQDGIARVVALRPDLADMLDITMRQLLRYAMGDPRTAERTVEMLRELAWVDHAGMLSEPLAAHRRAAAQAVQHSPLDGTETGRLLARLDTNHSGS